jgi:hypothetical protein
MMLLVALTGGAGFLASFLLRTDADTYDGWDQVAVEILDAVPDSTSRQGAAGRGEFSGGDTGRWEDGSSSEPLVELPAMIARYTVRRWAH